MGNRDGSVLKGRWSLRHEKCIECGTTEAPHEARGRCKRCFANLRYHKDIESNRAKRKLVRDRKKSENPEWYAAKRAREEAWKEANRDRYAKLKADWHRKNYAYKFPVGAKVWIEYRGWMYPGTVVSHCQDRRGKCTAVIVAADAIGELKFGIKRWALVHKSLGRSKRDINVLIERRLDDLRMSIKLSARKHALHGGEVDEFETEGIMKAVAIIKKNPETSDRYIKAAVKNRMLDLIRSRALRRADSIEDMIHDPSYEIDESAQTRLVVAQLYEKLSPRDIQIVELTAQGLTAEEAAEKMGISFPAFKSRLMRIREKAATLMEVAA